MNDLRNILPYATPPAAGRRVVGPRLIVLAWCFVPTWLGGLLIYASMAGPDREAFGWGRAVFWTAILGPVFGLPLYALALLCTLVAGRSGTGPAAGARANPPTPPTATAPSGAAE